VLLNAVTMEDAGDATFKDTGKLGFCSKCRPGGKPLKRAALFKHKQAKISRVEGKVEEKERSEKEESKTPKTHAH
jgi:hypothetical protein